MKKLIFMLSAVIFLFTACQKEEGALDPTATSESGFHKTDCIIVTPMIADGGSYDEDCGGIVVGEITAEEAGGIVTVTYTITEPGWVIDATQLFVGPLGDLPKTKKGNPKIGHFKPKSSHDPGVKTYTVTVPVPTDDDGDLVEYVISAHADVISGTAQGLCEILPATATLEVENGEPVSYMTATITDAGWLDGVYESWCIDEEHGIYGDIEYAPSDVYCTTNGEADFLVHDAANFDNLNWLLNQDFVGKTSACGGEYTVMDVQYAIWYLMDDYVQIPLPPDPENCRQEELEQLALDNGDDFVPGCGEYVAIALDPPHPDNPLWDAQKVIIVYPLTCEEETAWGRGYNTGDGQAECAGGADGRSFTNEFGGSAWGWFFYGCPLPIPAP